MSVEAPAAVSSGWRRSEVVGPFLLALLLFVPFLAKPIHIDDGSFLAMAGAIDPPSGVEPGHRYEFMGTTTDHFNPYFSTHPPGIPLYLKAVVGLAGDEREVALHLAFLVFPLMLAWSIADLARRIAVSPTMASAAVLGSAAVLPVGQTLMADLPATALWTVAVAAFLRARNGPRRVWAVAGVGAVVLASLAAYQAALLAPLAPLLTPGQRNLARSAARTWLPVATAALLAAAVAVGLALAGYLPFRAPLPEVWRGLEGDRLVNKGVSLPIYLGLVGLPFLPWTAREGWRRRPRLWVAALVAAGVVALLAGLGYGPLGSAWLGLLAFAGVLAAARAVQAAWGLADRALARLLLGWLAMIPLLGLLVVPFGSCRYLMLAIPPLVVLLLEAVPTRPGRVAATTVSVLLGLTVAIADYQLASTYRDFAREVAATVGPSRDRVWYVGDWGMQHYMAQAGFRYLTADTNEPQPGDLVVFAEVPRLWSPSPALRPRLELIDVREVRPRWPIHVMNERTRAGYYSALWGYHPFALDADPIERFGIFRVAR